MKKYKLLFREGSKVNQVICALLINLPVFSYGTSIGWMSPMALLMQSEDSPRDPPYTDSEVSWMAAVPYLMCFPADYCMAILGDKIGRKAALLFMSAVSVILWIIKLASYESWALILARTLVGISMAGSYVICPIYTKEISEDSIRGALGSLVILSHTTGNLFAYVIGDVFSYNTILWLCLLAPVLHILMFITMPESPSYLIKKGKDEEAAKVIAWLRCRSENDRIVLQELDVIRNEQKKDEGSSGCVLKDILKNKILSRAFSIAMIVTLSREICGAIPVLNFAGEIFSMASSADSWDLSPNQQAMLLGAVQVAGSLLASSVVEKFGRKPLLFISSLVSGLSMCGLASWFLVRHLGISALGWLPITTLCLCIFCDSSGLQPISVVITGEIFSYKYRGTVLAYTMSTSGIGDFLQLLFFKPVATNLGIHYVFYFFGVVCILNAVYVILIVPETRMRSLEQIYEDLKSKKEKKRDAIKMAAEDICVY